MRPVTELEREILAEAIKEGTRLNPGDDIRLGVIEGLSRNEERLGYWRCPCRFSKGDRVEDQDIICPCAYRDADLAEYGRCYCALYVTQAYIDRGLPPDPVPERRPPPPSNEKMRSEEDAKADRSTAAAGPLKVWRCQVCGYLCARSEPPPVCPICRAKKERFEMYPLKS